MAYTIISESYGPRKPKIICTADSLDDLANLDCAEGSEATVGGTRYVLDRVNGWVEPGGGGGVFIVTLTPTAQDLSGTLDKTISEINAAVLSGKTIVFQMDTNGTGLGFGSIQFNGNVVREFTEDGKTIYSVSGEFIEDGLSAIVGVHTASSFVGDGYYGTSSYTLTPMS